MSNYFDLQLVTEQFDVPARVYVEHRRNVRASLGKNHVILRLPQREFNKKDHHINHLKSWLTRLLERRPNILDKYQLDKVPKNITILGQYQYEINVDFEEAEQANGILENGQIFLTIPAQIAPSEQRKLVRKLNSKLISKVYKPLAVKKIHQINDAHFKKEIKGISLRYNSTNWGSCSAKGRINLSTRSLLLPENTFDYIIIHELSHLIELNHSKRFWNIVKEVMPEYKIHEAYLKKNSSKIDF